MTEVWARTVAARLGQRAVYSWKVQVPQTWGLQRWTLGSSTAQTREPDQIPPRGGGARAGGGRTSRVRAQVTRSWCQAPYSAKDSRAFQAAGCSRARTDWVMVCSSTLSAMAVIHSAKRWKPRGGKAQAKALGRASQMDHVSLASVMMRLLDGAS